MAAQHHAGPWAMSIVAGGVESMSRVPMGGFNPSFNPKLVNNARRHRNLRHTRHQEPAASPGLYPDGHDGGKSGPRATASAAKSRISSPCAATSAPSPPSITASSAREIVPVPLPDGETMDTDEGPRRDTSLERLATLEPAFIEGGTVTAGNSSPLNDGASAACSCRPRRRGSWASSRLRACSRWPSPASRPT